MKVLAVDTSSSSGSIAFVDAGEVIAQRNEPFVKAHAEWLMGAIADMLAGIDARLSDIDQIAITVGPGSFTGLRIGVSTVKGLAWALKKPVTGVSTLKALALNIKEDGAVICPVLDARKKELYAGLYSFKDGSIEELITDRAISSAALCAEIDSLGIKNPFFVGQALNLYVNDFIERFSGARFATQEDWNIRASNVALLAEGNTASLVDARELTPIYKRRSEAEIKRPATGI